MTIRIPAGRAVVLLAALASTGCATKGDLRNLQTEMRALAARQDSLMAELRRQNLSTRDTIRQTSSQLFEIRGDVGSRLDRIELSLERLTELAGQNQRAMQSIRDQLESGGRRSMGGASGGGMGVPMSGGSPADAVDAYNAAVQMYGMNSYTAAAMGFQEFIDTFPGDDLVPEALFYLGESRIQLGDPEGALEAYRQVVQLHPTAAKAPRARLHIGLTHLEQGDRTEARIAFETVVATWPDSEEAAEAREALAGMGGGLRP